MENANLGASQGSPTRVSAPKMPLDDPDDPDDPSQSHPEPTVKVKRERVDSDASTSTSTTDSAEHPNEAGWLMDRITEPDAPSWWTAVPPATFPVSENIPMLDPSDEPTPRQTWSGLERHRQYPLSILASQYEQLPSHDQYQKDTPDGTGPLSILNEEFEAQFAEQGLNKSADDRNSSIKVEEEEQSLSEIPNKDAGPPVLFLEWSNLDYEAQSVVLLALSQNYGSFQKACQSIELRLGQVERWLELFTAEKNQDKRWQKYLKAMLWNPYVQPREGDNPVELKLLTRAHIHNAGRFLIEHGFPEVSNGIQGWAHQTYKWPLDIDISDYNPERIGTLLSPPPPPLFGFPDLVD